MRTRQLTGLFGTVANLAMAPIFGTFLTIAGRIFLETTGKYIFFPLVALMELSQAVTGAYHQYNDTSGKHSVLTRTIIAASGLAPATVVTIAVLGALGVFGPALMLAAPYMFITAISTGLARSVYNIYDQWDEAAAAEDTNKKIALAIDPFVKIFAITAVITLFALNPPIFIFGIIGVLSAAGGVALGLEKIFSRNDEEADPERAPLLPVTDNNKFSDYGFISTNPSTNTHALVGQKSHDAGLGNADDQKDGTEFVQTRREASVDLFQKNLRTPIEDQDATGTIRLRMGSDDEDLP